MQSRPGSTLFPYTTLFRSSVAALLYHRKCSGKPRARRQPERSKATKTCKFADVGAPVDRKSTRLNSSHVSISYAVFCLKKKINASAVIQHRSCIEIYLVLS